MNAQTVLLLVSFLAAAALTLGSNVPDGPPEPVGVPVPADSANRNAKQVGLAPDATPPVNGAVPDDLKADGFFWGGFGGWGGGWGYGYPRYYGGWGGGWGSGWGYRRPYGGWGWGW